MRKLKEHKSLSEIEKNILMKCKIIISDIDPFAELILYGSRSRGEAEKESDYDLLILTDREVNLEREDIFRKQLYPIEIDSGAVLTVFLVSKKDWDLPLYKEIPFYKNVKKDGIYL
jgi:uncharacterized protein